ncbi:AcrR family transcriptional regulator [Motilibacter peucedani]|uniref:AcrR family transcriptional regulator n=1 Tax=Motilibacter peucedani TaxID=598650 RepID=A0A420XPR4_9ACTN|nr:TetR family transcriptional regulator [Motilibacter peucedani]RKS75234.1 AcrR family transcriptional regulator [Motilibacter peucedani]
MSPPGSGTPRRRPGRPAGGSDAYERIVTAAREVFGAEGYDRASLRAIARAAGVDPSLVHHYFAGKEEVFVAAMDLPFDPRQALPAVVDGPWESVGERLVRFFLGVWADPAGRGPFVALLSAATGSATGAELLRGFVGEVLLPLVVPRVDGPDAELRVQAAAAQLVGLGLLRHVVAVEPLAGATDEDVVALVAPTVQRYLGPQVP